MIKSAAERRAFLKTLKPRLVEIAAAAAERSGPIDLEELRANVAAGRDEPESLEISRHAVTH